MTVKPIIKHPDQRLRQISVDFDFASDGQVAIDLKDTFESLPHSASGLAAVQIGYLRRVLIANVAGAKRIFINPVIEERSTEEWVKAEGCLSYPWLNGVRVTRPMHIKGTFWSPTEVLTNFQLDGWDARVFLHEFDHLNGITLDKYRRDKQNPLDKPTLA